MNNPLNLQAPLNNNNLTYSLEDTAREISRRPIKEWLDWVKYIVRDLDNRAQANGQRPMFEESLADHAMDVSERLEKGEWGEY